MWQDRESSDSQNTGEIEAVLLKAADHVAKEYLGLHIQYLAFYPGNSDIAGFLEREQKLIGVVTSNPQPAQRFTLAHEIGHYMLHTNVLSFRDRSLSAPDASSDRPVHEREADAFAAEFLIPRRYLRRAYAEAIGETLDLAQFDANLMDAIQMSGVERPSRVDWDDTSRLKKATIIARLRTFKGKIFIPLAMRFAVSPTALAIQLLHTGLLK